MGEGRRVDCPRVPMWVGAVGHRALRPEDVGHLRRAVGEVLADVQKRWGGALEPRLVTSLAEGADQLVAEEARARGWSLAVPLPLPESDYERDFGSHASLEAFRSLRSQAAMVFDVGLAPGVSHDQVREHGPAREAQYARAARVVAETCPIVIALWDGEDRDRIGGTAETMARVLHGWREDRDGRHLLDARQPKIVYHVWTPSREHPDITGIPFKWEITPEPERLESDVEVLEDAIARMAELDRDVCRRVTGALADVGADRAVPSDLAEALPRSLRDLLRWYAIADALALQYQRLVRWALPLLLVGALVAFAGYEEYTHRDDHPVWGLQLFVYTISAMFLAVGAIQAYAHERKFLDYRALAEGLRVQFFWRLCGLSDSVSEHYLRRHRGELSWIPMAVASLSLGAVFPASDDRGGDWPLGRRRRLARSCWLDRQRDFFGRKARSTERLRKINVAGAYVLLGAAFAIALALLAGLHEKRAPSISLHSIFIAIGMLLAMSAALRHFVERRGYETHARRYALMHGLAARALGAVGDDKASLESDSAADVFREFGRESLAENGDWLLLHRERPLEVPPPP